MSVHSKDSMNTGTTKLERIGLRARKYPETLFNNLGHVIGEDFLREMHRQMKGNKAVGIDGVSKESYETTLDENVKRVVQCIRRGTYTPKASRLTEIPKEDGSKRPLAVSCYEDKLVQMAVSQILTAIYEPVFLSCSFGFRPDKRCHDALRALYSEVYSCFDGAIIEIDLEKCFNTIPHNKLHEILEKKITDKRFLNLIDKLITAPVLEKDKSVRNERGCPQGSILSPILANIFLHEVIDTWFSTIKTSHIKGKAELIRYADDMVFVFQREAEARRVFETLPKRLAKYGLKLHEGKSRVIKSGQNAAARAHRQGERLPAYHFLGFTAYWGKARNGKWWRLMFKSRRDRMTSKLKGLKAYLKKMQNAKGTKKALTVVLWVLRGWVNYHSISDNKRCVHAFMKAARRLIWQWINRRGRRDPMSWANFNALMKEIGIASLDYWKTTSIFPCNRAEPKLVG